MEGLKKIVYGKLGIPIFLFLMFIALYLNHVENPNVYFLCFGIVILAFITKNQDYLPYIVGGAFFAFFVNTVVGFSLSTNFPVVAIISPSMEHGVNIETTHYRWLEENLGYDRKTIDSWPFSNGFYVGDLGIVKGEKEYKVGEVIVYKVPGQKLPVIHRIIKINEDGTYMTKGDNNPGLLPFERSVKREQVEGRVIFIIPKIGYLKVIAAWLLGWF